MKTMNHTEYQKKLKTKTSADLEFAIKDCLEAIKAMPEGENVGYYTDEVHYCRAELNRRSDFVKRGHPKPITNAGIKKDMIEYLTEKFLYATNQLMIAGFSEDNAKIIAKEILTQAVDMI